MNPDVVPRSVLVQKALDALAAVRERPRMYGGSWQGVETFILDALDQLDFALSWPHKPLGHVGLRWNYACSKVHRASNGFLSYTLAYDGVTDDEAVHAKYRAAMDEYLSCNGLYGYWIKHSRCAGCKGAIHKEDDGHAPHCNHDEPWPCPNIDGDKVVAYWREVYARVSNPDPEGKIFAAGRAAGLLEAADLVDQKSSLLTPADQRTDEKKWADTWHVGELAKEIRARAGEPRPGCAIPMAERFKTPQDFDCAEFIVASSLGLIPSGTESWFEHKGVFWSNAPLGNALGDVLQALIRGGVLTRNEDDQYVWFWDPERKLENCPQCSYNGHDPTGYAPSDPADPYKRCPHCDGTRYVIVEPARD